MIYKGKEPCQGCGKTGKQVPRTSKDSLCDDCKKHLLLGKRVKEIFNELNDSVIELEKNTRNDPFQRDLHESHPRFFNQKRDSKEARPRYFK